jgi:hypothetical protein
MKKLIYILGIVTVLVTFSSCTVEELLQIQKAKESGVLQPQAQPIVQPIVQPNTANIDPAVVIPK